MTTSRWLDVTAAQAALERTREEVRKLLALPLDEEQREALEDTLGCLVQAERDLVDARPPKGDHPGDCEDNVQAAIDDLQRRLRSE